MVQGEDTQSLGGMEHEGWKTDGTEVMRLQLELNCSSPHFTDITKTFIVG